MLWDRGEWICEGDPEKSYQKGHLTFTLKAKKLKGKWHLVRFKKEDRSWFLVKAKDNYTKSADAFDITEQKTKSIVSFRTMEEIAAQTHSIKTKENIRKKTPCRK